VRGPRLHGAREQGQTQHGQKGSNRHTVLLRASATILPASCRISAAEMHAENFLQPDGGSSRAPREHGGVLARCGLLSEDR
jgi:hypothetical protein